MNTHTNPLPSAELKVLRAGGLSAVALFLETSQRLHEQGSPDALLAHGTPLALRVAAYSTGAVVAYNVTMNSPTRLNCARIP
jgi:hypothetical protein